MSPRDYSKIDPRRSLKETPNRTGLKNPHLDSPTTLDHCSLDNDRLWDQLRSELSSAKITTTFRVGGRYWRYRENCWPKGVRLYCRKDNPRKYLVYFENSKALNRWEMLVGRPQSCGFAYDVLRFLANLIIV